MNKLINIPDIMNKPRATSGERKMGGRTRWGRELRSTKYYV